MNKAILFALCAMAFTPLAEFSRAGESPIILAQADAASEQADWEKIVNSTNPDDFLDFISKYPDGIFRSTAEAQIKRLYLHTGGAPAAPANPPAAASAEPAPQQQEPASAQPAIRQAVPNVPAAPATPAAPPVQQAQPATPPPAQQPSAAATNADTLSPAAQKVLALRMDTQRELARVGCFGGTVDGRWDMRSSEALRIYARKKGLVLPSWDPTQDVLERLIIERGEICSAPACLVTEVSRNGQCVEKACPVGEQLSPDGRCRTASEAAAVRTAPAAVPPAPAPTPAPEPAPAQVQPGAIPLRPAAPAAEPAPQRAEPAPRAIERRATPERRVTDEPRRKRIEPEARPVRKAAKKPPARVEVVRPRREQAAPQKRRARAPCSAAVKGLPEYDYCE